jgi:hypothetical protein
VAKSFGNRKRTGKNLHGQKHSQFRANPFTSSKSFHLLTLQSFCSKSSAWRHTERCIASNYDVECVAFILKFIEILIAGKEFYFNGNIKLVSQELSLLGVCQWERQLDLR